MSEKQYMTIVLELPDDQKKVRKIVQMFRFAGDFNGAVVTALMAGDAITKLEELDGWKDQAINMYPHLESKNG